jgi:hypothetical protein
VAKKNAGQREQTQKTPKGYEIPVPKRESALRDFRRVVAPQRGPVRPKE